MIDPLLVMLLSATTFGVFCGFCVGYAVREWKYAAAPTPAAQADSAQDDLPLPASPTIEGESNV